MEENDIEKAISARIIDPNIEWIKFDFLVAALLVTKIATLEADDETLKRAIKITVKRASVGSEALQEMYTIVCDHIHEKRIGLENYRRVAAFMPELTRMFDNEPSLLLSRLEYIGSQGDVGVKNSLTHFARLGAANAEYWDM